MGMIIILALTLGGVIGLCAIIAGIFGNLASKNNTHNTVSFKPRPLTQEEIECKKKQEEIKKGEDIAGFICFILGLGLLYGAFHVVKWIFVFVLKAMGVIN